MPNDPARTPACPLPAGQVRVYALEVPPDFRELVTEPDAAAKVLSANEMARFRRYRVARRRNDLVLSRVLLRVALAHMGAADGGTPELRLDERGKPHLAPGPVGPPLQVNTSDTTGMIIWAFSREGRLGCDVERLGEDRDRIATTHFAAPELAAYRSLRGTDKLLRFYELWTCKEAVLKADGRGLGVPLDSFCLRFPTPGPEGSAAVEILAAATGPAPGPWQVRRFRPGPGHQAAVACTAPHDIDLCCCVVRLGEADPALARPWTLLVHPVRNDGLIRPDEIVFTPGR